MVSVICEGLASIRSLRSFVARFNFSCDFTGNSTQFFTDHFVKRYGQVLTRLLVI